MKKLGAIALVTLLGLTLPSSPAAAHPAGAEHHPDLQTLKPSELRITRTCGYFVFNCKRYLRFSNIVGNYGHGRLEMRPQNNGNTGKTAAYQRIYSHDATGRWYLAREQYVGDFAFHTAHNHWHFEGFANYSLVTANAADNAITGATRRNSQKTTFCVIDTNKLPVTLEHGGSQTYTRCGQNDMTGLSVGWGDRYGWDLAGQEIDLNGISDGFYWLVSSADFQRRLVETNETNNCAAAKIEIRGSSVYDRGHRIPC
ncbi:MAG TPA: lysyl oxidase family protein [Solirubrobacteraceae bacterium]|nr:lysyl oxidase family protein [Solirubrobacteraceae bacterium]